MKVSISMDDKQLTDCLVGLDEVNITQALTDAGQIVINSTKIGYLKKVDPDGINWSPNPEWYILMKGQSSPLTGPTSRVISGGQWKGYEFDRINTRRMENSLISNVDPMAKKVTVEYDTTVAERASITQHGGESDLVLRSKSGGTLTLKIKAQARVHLGVADKFQRLGSKTDTEHIQEAFGLLVDRHFEPR